MYSQGSYGAASSVITNNPFVSDPTNAQSRYPDISGGGSNNNNGYPGDPNAGAWMQQQPAQNGSNYSGYQTQQQMYSQPSGFQQQHQQPQQQQQQQQQQQYPSSVGMNPQMQMQSQYANPQQNLYSQQTTTQPFQPSSSFGQQLVGQVNGSHGSYGYLQQQGMGTPQGYPLNAQQQIQNNPGYIAQFDPYSAIGQGGWGDNIQSQTGAPQNAVQSPTRSTFGAPAPGNLGPNGSPHPRDYIRQHKQELETWDQYSWKQLLSAFEALKDTWDARKRELMEKIGALQQQLQFSGGGYYATQIQQEGMRLQGLAKEADSNADSTSASIFQMREVFAGYRQSGDLASKRRVRESCNAALNNLPDWPTTPY